MMNDEDQAVRLTMPETVAYATGFALPNVVVGLILFLRILPMLDLVGMSWTRYLFLFTVPFYGLAIGQWSGRMLIETMHVLVWHTEPPKMGQPVLNELMATFSLFFVVVLGIMSNIVITMFDDQR